MKPISYALQFRGVASPVADGVLRAETRAPSTRFVTKVGPDGLSSLVESADGDDASFESEVRFSDESTFVEAGTIQFGRSNALTFHTVGVGVLESSPDPHLKHGTVMWEVEGGEGQFAGATGRITSNFFVSDTGEVTDNHYGVIWVA